MLEIEYLYQDEHLVVVSKPSGLLSTPGKGPHKIDSVSHRITQRYRKSISHPAVHRLDMDTSGIMVLGLTTESHRQLSIQFQERRTEKQYEALLEDIIEEEQGRIELSFRLDYPNRPYQIIDDVHGKLGLTLWKKLAVENGQTRIEFMPITGRTHQLRLHSAHERGLGSPIVGDPLYGQGTGPGRMKLHAKLLSFDHPARGQRMTFESTPPF